MKPIPTHPPPASLTKEDPIRQALWSYHGTLGVTLFLLVLVRGIWGFVNLPRRPGHEGLIGRAAAARHVAIYALMGLVPATRLLDAAGSKDGLSYLGLQIFPARQTEVAWMQVPSEWHGEMGWVLLLIVLGHITMAVGWHYFIKRDGVMKRMTG